MQLLPNKAYAIFLTDKPLLTPYWVGKSLSVLKIAYTLFQQQTALHIMDLDKMRNLHCQCSLFPCTDNVKCNCVPYWREQCEWMYMCIYSIWMYRCICCERRWKASSVLGSVPVLVHVYCRHSVRAIHVLHIMVHVTVLVCMSLVLAVGMRWWNINVKLIVKEYTIGRYWTEMILLLPMCTC